MELVRLPEAKVELKNLIGGQWVSASGAKAQVLTPYLGKAIGAFHHTPAAEVAHAAEAAARAAREWGATPIKERTQVLFKFRELLLQDLEAISHRIAGESGKLVSEARAGLMKGIEVLEFAIAIQNLDVGGKMDVSRGVSCEYQRVPLGVVAGITPFNFPAMVPMWMIPIALAMGNAFIWKPSDKTPLTSQWIADALTRAGLPAGVLSIVHGGRETVEAICDHPGIHAVGFVGSTDVARQVFLRASSAGKRALCLGGAKNHIVLMPDAEKQMAAQGILASFTGCAGQRCMAASVLVSVGDTEDVLQEIQGLASKMQLGKDMGAIISEASLDKLSAAVDRAHLQGAKILHDGRTMAKPVGYESGFWMGPTILDQVQPGSEAATDELFGPVLSVVRAKNLTQALEIASQSRYGNALSVFTQSGAVADEIVQRSRAGMIGVNIGVPVPREPFSFGGFLESRFGYGDMTGQGGMEFWSNLRKVTTKWTLQKDQNWMN
jgi:malonate-semialdehyde dehydrogenase (acetylating)/methylmalonate-semialdehyde dehydrogenase